MRKIKDKRTFVYTENLQNYFMHKNEPNSLFLE